jgi:hypothetical protein
VTTRRSFAAVGSLFVAAAIVGTAYHASAEPTGPKVELIIVHAFHCEKKERDPRIPQSTPNMGYECMKQIDRKILPMQKGQASTTTLPNGRVFFLTYHGLENGKHKLGAALNQPDGGPAQMKLADIAAEVDKPFNFGGLSHDRGVLFLTVKVLP